MSFDASTIDTATTAVLSAGVYSDTFTGGATDVDMVRIDLVAGVLYTVDIDNGTSGDLYLRIFDAFGNEVRANDDGLRSTDDVILTLSPFLGFVPNFTGTYYAAVSAYYMDDYDPESSAGRALPDNPLGSTHGTLTITQVGSQASWGTAAAISSIIGESSNDLSDILRDEDESLRLALRAGIENPTDIDISRVDLNKNDIVVVDVNGLDANGTVLRVFDDGGLQIGFNDDSGFGTEPELVFAAPISDDYYIGISGEGNSAYVGMDGTGAVAGEVGSYEVIIHRNPTQIGTAFGNVMVGNEAANYIVGLSGIDSLFGVDGKDTLAGGDDDDRLFGGNNGDTLYGEQGNDSLAGDSGEDVLVGGLGSDSLNGGSADDILSGGDGQDSLFGGNGTGADTMAGDAGNDALFGGGGVDGLNGGLGDDQLNGGSGNDQLVGGDGNDSLTGGTGDDSLLGGFGNDSLAGQDGNDSLLGDSGNDLLSGQGGNDLLQGGLGDDNLQGGAGLDTLVGSGTGSDFMAGGADADVFRFVTVDALDTVADFALGVDLIDLSVIFAAAGSVVTGANLAQFVQVTPAGAGADTFLAIDANGATGGLVFTIIAQVNAVTTVQLFDADNFIL